MRKIIFCFISLVVFFSYKKIHGQQNTSRPYWIFFTDKDSTHFDPYSFFDPKAIQRRIRNHLPLFDYDDIPVKTEYIDMVKNLCDTIIYPSRWFNAVYAYLQESQLSSILALPFVKEIQPAKYVSSSLCMIDNVDSTLQYAQTIPTQLALMRAEVFLNKNILGQGVRIAVFDAGFPGVDTIKAFQHLFAEKKIIATYDFRKKREFVYDYNQHGTMVLSCIAGMKIEPKTLPRLQEGEEKSFQIDTIVNFHYYGLAPQSEFLLARTEIPGEILAEEIYWIAALEWADQLGADIVNSSLGYTYHRYFPYQMDGKTTLISKAASKAMKKGILVINAAGNDGNKSWHVIGAPADADSIISVGGIDPDNLLPTNFSSRGPTADGRLKPDVCAAGWVNAINKHGKQTYVAGTSFASPLVTGFAACLLSMNTTLPTSELYQKIRESGHLYPYFDYAHGFGIPNAKKIMGLDTPEVNSFEIKLTSDSIIFTILTIDSTSDSVFYEPPIYQQFYAHCESPQGILRWYEAYPVSPFKTISYSTKQFKPGDTFRCYYRRQFFEYKF